jgi:hypothetical protein
LNSNDRSPSPKFPFIYRSRMFITSPRVVPILSLMNPVHTLVSYFFKTRYNIILLRTPISPSLFLSFRNSQQKCWMHLSSLPLVTHVPYSLMRRRIIFTNMESFLKLNGNNGFLDYGSLDSGTNEIIRPLNPGGHNLKFHRPENLECHDYILIALRDVVPAVQEKSSIMNQFLSSRCHCFVVYSCVHCFALCLVEMLHCGWRRRM